MIDPPYDIPMKPTRPGRATDAAGLVAFYDEL